MGKGLDLYSLEELTQKKNNVLVRAAQRGGKRETDRLSSSPGRVSASLGLCVLTYIMGEVMRAGGWGCGNQ